MFRGIRHPLIIGQVGQRLSVRPGASSRQGAKIIVTVPPATVIIVHIVGRFKSSLSQFIHPVQLTCKRHSAQSDPCIPARLEEFQTHGGTLQFLCNQHLHGLKARPDNIFARKRQIRLPTSNLCKKLGVVHQKAHSDTVAEHLGSTRDSQRHIKPYRVRDSLRFS